MREIADAAVADGKIDDHRRAAKPRMGLGARIRGREAAEPRNIGGQLEHPLVVDFVQHGGKTRQLAEPASTPI